MEWNNPCYLRDPPELILCFLLSTFVEDVGKICCTLELSLCSSQSYQGLITILELWVPNPFSHLSNMFRNLSSVSLWRYFLSLSWTSSPGKETCLISSILEIPFSFHSLLQIPHLSLSLFLFWRRALRSCLHLMSYFLISYFLLKLLKVPFLCCSGEILPRSLVSSVLSVPCSNLPSQLTNDSSAKLDGVSHFVLLRLQCATLSWRFASPGCLPSLLAGSSSSKCPSVSSYRSFL